MFTSITDVSGCIVSAPTEGDYFSSQLGDEDESYPLMFIDSTSLAINTLTIQRLTS